MLIQSIRSKFTSRAKVNRKNDSFLYSFGNYRLRMMTLMALADLGGLSIAVAFANSLDILFPFHLFDLVAIDYLVIGLLFIFLFLESPLYPGVGIGPDEEMKLVTQYVSVSFTVGLVLHVLLDTYEVADIWAMLFIGGFSIFSIQFLRWSIRIFSVQLGWWGEPVAIVAHPKRIHALMDHFLHRYRLGFKPAVTITDIGQENEASYNIPVINMRDYLNGANDYRPNIQTVLIDTVTYGNDLPEDSGRMLMQSFKRVIFVSDLEWMEGATIRSIGLEGVLGIEAQRNVISPLYQIVKRGLDIVLALALGVISLPILIITAILIRLEDAGSVFYTQQRLGYKGDLINIYKFRSMRKDADQYLKEYLQRNPVAQQEWEQNQKLANDPRITRVGKWLRKFSVDELPQLFNVLKGDMSLVGPRPMMPEQIEQYGEEKMEAYYSVLPGLTGLWQVSGRNRTTFQERARFDLYYVRNWSPWLDLYILMRTGWVVLSQYGAL